MTKHRFTRPGKSEAYETALAIVEELSDDALLAWGWRTYNAVRKGVARAHPMLSKKDAEHVAAKALRVERGKRRKR